MTTPVNSRPQYGLAIHTSSSDLGLAISNFGHDARSQTWALGRAASTHLHSHLAEFLQPQTWTDLGFIAVAKGPGSFTGTRIGVVTARTLAQQLEIPLFAISTLAGVAWSARSHFPPDSTIALQMVAQRGELFTALYQITPTGLQTLLPDCVMQPDQWQQTLATWATPYHLIAAEDALGNSVASLLALAFLEWKNDKRPHWSEALPFYGQHPVTRIMGQP